jgi:heterodisulfide reductase subunit D
VTESEARINRDTHVLHCLECGKCTANCPVARVNPEFSPRMQISRLLSGSLEALITDNQLYTCLSCGMCSARCPSDVRYTELMLLTRIEAYKAGHTATISHGGVLQEIMKIHAAQKLKTAEKGELLYFTGCLPYFDAVFTDIGVEALKIGRSVITILNALGETPVVMPNERCCGHDLLWGGDEQSFLKLMKHNLAAIKETGAKRVVTACAECFRTLKSDYARYAGGLDFEVQHVSQYLAGRLPELEPKLKKKVKKKVAFQDPCRLGRHMGVYEEPRLLLEKIPGVEVSEMRRNREAAVCCGTSAWMNCDMYSKKIQVGRLKEAEQSGADTVITCCPKCYIHFTCATSEKNGKPAVEIAIQDLCVLLAESLGAREGPDD